MAYRERSQEKFLSISYQFCCPTLLGHKYVMIQCLYICVCVSCSQIEKCMHFQRISKLSGNLSKYLALHKYPILYL